MAVPGAGDACLLSMVRVGAIGSQVKRPIIALMCWVLDNNF